MKIAVTYENGEIYQHFGHCQVFKTYTVEDSNITETKEEPVNGSGHSALAGFLMDKNVDVLICGGIGGGARIALAQCGIDLYPGAAGNADEAVEAFLGNKLNYNPDTVCNHHHGQGHTCGEHDENCGHLCENN